MTSPFLLLTECAAHARVPVSTIRHWIAIGKFASVRPGRRRLVRRDDFEAFLASAETQRTAELPARDSTLVPGAETTGIGATPLR
jgi:excisionase family DNA binding protein